LRCLTKTDGEDFIPVFGSSNSNSLFIFEHQHEHRQKKLSQKVRHLVTICTPKEAQSRIFVTGGSFFVRQMLRAKKYSSSRGGELVGHICGTSASWGGEP
jgi:hypothetical protein